MSDYQEDQRQIRWHEVYMTVLKAQMPVQSYNVQAFGYGQGNVTVLDIDGAHARAKATADKAYPRPESV